MRFEKVLRGFVKVHKVLQRFSKGSPKVPQGSTRFHSVLLVPYVPHGTTRYHKVL